MFDRVDAKALDFNQRKKTLGEAGTYESRNIIVLFSDIEGKLHSVKYNTDFLKNNLDNLTFDGSSIKGFTSQSESDLKLCIENESLKSLPNIFGDNLVCFGSIKNKDGSPFESDIRYNLKKFIESQNKKMFVSAEIEGFLFQNKDAEQNFNLKPTDYSNYYSATYSKPINKFIDYVTTLLTTMNFNIEKCHSEVAVSQFEINWKYTDALEAADNIQLYKLICRDVANIMNCTASFLPKPIMNVNGNGMHINMSILDKENLFYSPDGLSDYGTKFANGILNVANDLCLVLNSSVNSYRRLDPHYEAPNQIFSSPTNRGAMIRIPLANKNSSRIEVRSVAPDANPYLLIYSLFKAGLDGVNQDLSHFSGQQKYLPGTIQESMKFFSESQFIKDTLTETVQNKYLKLKKDSADRCPASLGNTIKKEEIIYHHEVTNQELWNGF